MKLSIGSLVCSFAALTGSAVALPQEAAWDYGWDYSAHPGFYPLTVKGTPDGGVVMAGLARSLPLDDIESPSEVVIAKFNENGDRVWRVERPVPPGYAGLFVPDLVDVDVAPNGNVYVVEPRESGSRLVRYRPDGTFAWERAAGLVTGQAYQVLMTLVDSSVPGEIVIAGSHMEALFYPHLQLQSFGLGGGRQFSIPSVAEPNSPDLIVTGLERGPSGEIFVMGPKDVVGTVAAYAGVHCYDASGAQLWARHLGNLGFYTAPQDVVASPSGETTILSNAMLEFVEPFDMVLTRVDSAGTQIFERRYSPNPGGVVTGRALELLPGGGFVVAGSIQRTMVSSERSFALMYFDANGQETGVAYLPGVAPETPGEAEHITMDRDGNLVVLGWSEDPSDEGVLASFDPMGNPRWVRRIAGTRPLSSLTSSTSSALAYDVNGNALSLTQVVKSGVAPNQDLALRLIKTMRGGDVGTSFCGPAVPNSTGVPAELRVLGLDDVTENNVALVATDLPGGTATLLLASQAASSVPGAGGGQGTLCLGGSIGRYVGPGQVRRASANGDASLQVDLDAVPQPTGLAQATAGQTWRFQAWYRDANPGTTSNMTNGVAVLLQ